MSTMSSLVRASQAEEAALLQTFENLENVLHAPEHERGSLWLKRLQVVLHQLEDVLNLHRRTVEAPNGLLPQGQLAGATPATLERRSEKLLQSLPDYIAQTKRLRHGTAYANTAELHQAASELLQGLRDFKAKERELLADSVTMETGVGD
jgi:hypothetical protein